MVYVQAKFKIDFLNLEKLYCKYTNSFWTTTKVIQGLFPFFL